MTYEIIPQVGFGPIKFGMSPQDVHKILGEPSEVTKIIGPYETDLDEIKFNGGLHFEWHGEYPFDGKFPQITYNNNNVIMISVSKPFGPLIYKSMDLHKAKKRQEFLEALAKDEDIYYYDEEAYFANV